jgi:hypothetical protein
MAPRSTTLRVVRCPAAPSTASIESTSVIGSWLGWLTRSSQGGISYPEKSQWRDWSS